MKIGILSDIHDNLEKLRAALDKLAKTEVLLCCGDLCSPFIVDELASGFPHGAIHVVFGNNDGDLFRITSKATGYSHLHLHGEFCQLDLDGRRIALHHFDDVARALAASSTYDLICFGHNHQQELTTVGQTLLINPGEVFGGLTGSATCALYETTSHKAQHVSL